MTVRVNKSAFNIREKLSELERPIGVKGNELMRAETAQDARDLVSAGRKNLLINGDMRIAQRGTSGTKDGSSYGGYLSVDRWAAYYDDTTIAQTDVTINGKVKKALKVTGASPNGRPYVYQKIENCSRLVGDGTPFSISFWARASANAEARIQWRYYDNGNENNSDNNTIKDIDLTTEWKHYKIENITEIDSNYSITRDAGIWFYNADSSVGNGLWFEFAEVQVELGKNATEFEHRSYGEELALCQRYYQKSYPTEVTPGTNVTASLGFAGMEGRTGMSGVSSSGEHFRGTKLFPSMRTTPNVTVYDRVGNAGKITGTKYLVADTDNVTGPVQNVCATGFQVKCINVGDFGGISFHYTADAEL